MMAETHEAHAKVEPGKSVERRFTAESAERSNWHALVAPDHAELIAIEPMQVTGRRCRWRLGASPSGRWRSSSPS